MSTSVIEPGARLAGRYRLEDRVRESGGSTLWRAIDEILARAVAVRTFDPDFTRVGAVVTAARAASRLTDPRLTQVFDADDSGEQAYVVSEWVTGESLEQMIVANGPMDPGRAATLLSEAAEAIAAAHAAGLAHLRLTLRDLLWTTGGTVKVVGVAVDAELAGITAEDPALVDAQGLGHMLYAAVTGHWPGESGSELPAAPMAGSQICAPRQVKAGVPYALDALVCRVLRLPMQGAGPQEPISTPAALAQALTGVPRTPLPLFAGLGSGPPPSIIPRQPRDNGSAGPVGGPGGGAPTQSRSPGSYGGAGLSPAHGGLPGPAQSHAGSGPAGRPSTPHPASPAHRAGGPNPTRSQAAAFNAMGPGPAATQRSSLPEHGSHDGLEFSRATTGSRGGGGGGKPVNRPLVALAATLATIIVVIGAWQLTNGGGSSDSPGTQPSSAAVSPSSAATAKEIDLRSAEGVDPEGQDSGKGSDKGRLAIDGKESTRWRSSFYESSDFGRLKKGLGLLVDLGDATSITEVKLDTPISAGATIELRVGDSNDPYKLDKVASETSSGSSTVTLKPSGSATGRYVLIWFTKLSTGSDGKLRAEISEVSVHGSTV